MKKNAIGNGTTQCILCGDEFGLLGASPTYCDDCKKVTRMFVPISPVQFKRVPACWGKPVCAAPRLSGVPPALPLKQFECWSYWWWAFFILLKNIKCFCLCLSCWPSMVWCPWLGACRSYLKHCNTSDLLRCKPHVIVMVAFPTTLSTESFSLIPSCVVYIVVNTVALDCASAGVFEGGIVSQLHDTCQSMYACTLWHFSLSVCLYLCLSVYLSVCPCLCLCLSLPAPKDGIQ